MKVMRSLDDGDSIARVRREIGALIIELDGSADRNITVLEDRLRELKDCIAEADKRIVMLSSGRARPWVEPLVPLQRSSQDHLSPAPQPEQAVQPTPVPVSPEPFAREVPEPVAREVPEPVAREVSEPVPREAREPVSETREADRESGPLGKPRTAPVPFIRFSDKPLVFEEPFAERVARLHKRGFSSDIIAAKLKATIAEVDLAIAAGWNPPEGRGEA
jgi:hypothetical protein